MQRNTRKTPWAATALRRGALCAALLLAAGTAAAIQPAVRGAEPPNQRCGRIYTDHYGPIDFVANRAGAKIVEDHHYTPRVRAALGGSTGHFGQDINYTLKAVPNHHEALVSLVRWVERVKRDQTFGMEWPVECYFDRAIRYRPGDTVVRALYAQFLAKRKRQADAVQQLDYAASVAGDNAFSHYNLGLVYLEIGEPAKALVQAHKAQALGFPRQELADALKQAGAWREPAPAAPEGPASGAAPAAAPAASATN